jgi:hypothetical protein
VGLRAVQVTLMAMPQGSFMFFAPRRYLPGTAVAWVTRTCSQFFPRPLAGASSAAVVVTSSLSVTLTPRRNRRAKSMFARPNGIGASGEAARR